MAHSLDVPHKSLVRQDRRSFWPIFALSFTVFLAIAVDAYRRRNETRE